MARSSEREAAERRSGGGGVGGEENTRGRGMGLHDGCLSVRFGRPCGERLHREKRMRNEAVADEGISSRPPRVASAPGRLLRQQREPDRHRSTLFAGGIHRGGLDRVTCRFSAASVKGRPPRDSVDLVSLCTTRPPLSFLFPRHVDGSHHAALKRGTRGRRAGRPATRGLASGCPARPAGGFERHVEGGHVPAEDEVGVTPVRVREHGPPVCCHPREGGSAAAIDTRYSETGLVKSLSVQ